MTAWNVVSLLTGVGCVYFAGAAEAEGRPGWSWALWFAGIINLAFVVRALS